MEDSFNVRVGKVFGSLDASSNSKSLWKGDKKTHQEDEDNEGKGFFHNFPPKNKKNAIDFGVELEKDLDGLDDEEEEARASSSKQAKPDYYNDEEWEIKSSIGRDCTLDYEEEEDAYDKVAVGRDKNEDCLYLKDVNDYDIDADSDNGLPSSNCVQGFQ